jgi:hypothetical protein
VKDYFENNSIQKILEVKGVEIINRVFEVIKEDFLINLQK